LLQDPEVHDFAYDSAVTGLRKLATPTADSH
jgi:hypothetical protein